MPPLSNILSLLSLPENRQYLSRFTRRSFEEKNIVSDKETRRGGIFIVTAGRLRVYLSYEGREFTLLFLEPGDVFSMHSEAIIEARQRSEILLTDIEGFEDILLHIPSVSLTAVALLGKVLMNTTHIIEDLMFRDVKSRLLRFLIELTEQKGQPGLWI
jgi:CRP-like cAMP-binding protein